MMIFKRLFAVDDHNFAAKLRFIADPTYQTRLPQTETRR